jgi:hypothetical protein
MNSRQLKLWSFFSYSAYNSNFPFFLEALKIQTLADLEKEHHNPQHCHLQKTFLFEKLQNSGIFPQTYFLSLFIRTKSPKMACFG